MFRTLLGKNSIVIVVSRGVIAKCIQCQVKKYLKVVLYQEKNLKDITVCLAKAALLVNIFIISLIIVVLEEELLQSVSSIR